MKKAEPFYKSFIAYGIGIFIIVFPYITYLHLEKLSVKDAMLFPNTEGYIADFFLYFKEVGVITFAVFLILFFIGEHIFPDHVIKGVPLLQKKSFCFLIPIGVYAVCILLSMLRGCLSGNGRAVLWGSCTEYEGGLALLSYLILFCAAYNYFSKEKYIRILYRCMDILIILTGILAMIEYFYQPIYEFDFMKYLIAPEMYRSIAESMRNESYQGQAALALYNPGYLGGLSALLFPVALSKMFRAKDWKSGLIASVFPVCSIFALIASNSTGAFYAAGISLLAFLLFYGREQRKQIRFFFYFAAVLFVFFLILCIGSEGKFTKTLEKTIFHTGGEAQTEKFQFQTMQLSGGNLVIETENDAYTIGYSLEKPDSGEVRAFNLEGLSVFRDEEKMELEPADSGLMLVTEQDGNLFFEIEDDLLFIDFGYDSEVGFYLTEDGLMLAGLNGTRLEEIPQSSMQKFERFYSIATGRGYMWLNTLPILKKVILIGEGPGTFVYYFLQNEVSGLLKTHGSSYFVVDKPHNWYLQMAVHTGVVSVLAVFALIFQYIKRCFVLFKGSRRKSETEISYILPLFIGVMAFCITGIVNDSIITVNPVFWIVFGAGCSMLEHWDTDTKKP